MKRTVKDARSFYAAIKNNPLYDTMEDETVISILEEEFKVREEIGANKFSGWKLKEYLFWTGALLGCQLMAKIFKHHAEASAFEQNIDPKTGERYADKTAQ